MLSGKELTTFGWNTKCDPKSHRYHTGVGKLLRKFPIIFIFASIIVKFVALKANITIIDALSNC
jgi:hypothetical protein